jgi:hypothetical protein
MTGNVITGVFFGVHEFVKLSGDKNNDKNKTKTVAGKRAVFEVSTTAFPNAGPSRVAPAASSPLARRILIQYQLISI